VKLILDTNVFVSGVFFSGPPFQILQGWRDEMVQLVISTEILEEYQRVGLILAQEHPLIDLMSMLDYLVQHAEVYSVPSLPERVDKFLACAIASGGTLVVSGDRHLLKVSGYQGVEVLKPREFVDKHLQQE
jgi:putative PIN family toxin of toxin-antitoxin system